MQDIKILKETGLLSILDYTIVNDFFDYCTFLSDFLTHYEIDELHKIEGFPNFDLYRVWKRNYPGWRAGILDKENKAYKPNYYSHTLPMNQLYERTKIYG